MKQFYIFLVAILTTGLGFGQTTIYTQDFETDLSGYSHTPSQTPSTDSGDQYFHRAEPSDTDIYESGGPYTNVTGSWLFVGSNPNTFNSGSPGILNLDPIDVSGFSSLELSADFGGVPNDWDPTDELSVEYSWDNSSWNVLYNFQSPATNDPLVLGNNASGGNNTANGAILTYALQTIVSNNFSGSGTTLYVRIVCDSDANYEAFGLDNITLTGISSSNPTINFDAETSTENETDATFSTTIPVTITNYDSPVTVSVTVNGAGSAEAGDYSLITTSLTFNANETQNISLDINADAGFEDETLILDIAVSSGTADIGTSQHTVTIVDDEVAPPVTRIAFQSFEGGDSWSYTTDPAPFNAPSAVWDVVDNTFHTFSSMPSDAINFFGIQDLESTNGTSGFGTLDFETVYVGGFTNVVVTFDFEVDGFDSNDDIKYELFEDNVSQGEVVIVDGFGNLDADGTIEINITPGTTSIKLIVSVKQNGDGDYGALDNFKVEGLFDGLTYAEGTWTPSAPTSGTGTTNALIANGDYTIASGTIALQDVTVNPTAGLIVESGATLTTNSITLESDSRGYSSLINRSSGTIDNVTYNRHTNIQGSGAAGTGGNDLISLPLFPSGGLTFDTFLTFGSPANSTKIPDNGIFYGFGPYNNTSQSYSNFAIANASLENLEQGKGYRTATITGGNLTHLGEVETGNVSITVTTPIGGSQWNLIGNPFPSYVNSSSFIAWNDTNLDPSAQAIYGYNSGTYSGTGDTTGNFTIISLSSNSTLNIAPGQGFFVAAKPIGNYTAGIDFTTGGIAGDMRTNTGVDDFIEGRTSDINYNLKLALIDTETHKTSFYFNTNSTLGLNPGYDVAAFDGLGNTYNLYSHISCRKYR